MFTKSVRKMMSVGGILATFAVPGFAQVALKATIGFPFTAQGHKLEAGAYEIRPANIGGSNNGYFLRNLETRKAIIVTSLYANTVLNSTAVTPKLSFQCNEGQYCALKQVWDGSQRYTEIAVPKKSSGEDRLMEVALRHNRK